MLNWQRSRRIAAIRARGTGMADDKTKEGRVIAGQGQNIFANPNGGRNGYGALILNALTGLSTEELANTLEARGATKEHAEKLKKDIALGGEVDATLLDSEDQFFRDYLRIHAGPSLLAPPIAPERLERLVSENNALEPCIEAMVTNISCTGYTLVNRDKTEADLTDEDKSEREGLLDFLKEVYPRKSFQRTRKELRRDLHRTGNSYMVLERNALGELAFIRRAPAKSMRLIKLDEPTEVTVKMRRAGKDVELTTLRAERRYVQKIGTKLVYYKEYGSQRDLNRVTGEWAPDGQTLPANKRAHEVIHDKDIEDVKSPYGMPRWITQLPSVLGSRMAEEHNLAYFQSGGVPPVMVFITGGMVSEPVAKAINDYLTGGSKTKQRGVAVEVPSSGNLENERPASVTVERFGSQEADSTFEVYDEKNEQRVRRSFRLPGIFLGMADSYNFACYDAETEALTDQGWITHDQFKPGMKVACYNPKAKALEYHEPDHGVQVYDVTDVPMYHFKSTLMDIMVTPKHRMHYETQYGDVCTEPVETMLATCSRPSFVRRIPEYKVGVAHSTFTFTFPHVPAPIAGRGSTALQEDYPPTLDTTDLYELAGWIISEGHVLKQGGAISLTQHVDRGWSSIKALLLRLEAKDVTVWWPKTEEGVVTAYVYDWSIYSWFKDKMGMVGWQKRIPRSLLASSRGCLRILFDALMAGDGSWDTREGRTSGSYYTTSKSLADDVQELALKLGYHTSVADATPGTMGVRPGYRVFIGMGGSRGAEGRTQTARGHERVDYTGEVWCFTVPTGVFVTRRNGHVAVQGNTAHASYVVAEAQVFAPEREEEDERMNMTIMREIDPSNLWELASKPLSVQDVNLQLRALQMLSTMRGVGIADLVKDISRIADLEVEVSEDFEEDVIGGTVAGQEGATPGQPPTNPPANADAAPQGDTEQQAAPNPPEAVNNRVALMAARIARSVREYDDLSDAESLRTLMALRTEYDDLSLDEQERVNKALAPVLYNSTFLTDAAMADVAAGYAMAAFQAAQRETDHALH